MQNDRFDRVIFITLDSTDRTRVVMRRGATRDSCPAHKNSSYHYLYLHASKQLVSSVFLSAMPIIFLLRSIGKKHPCFTPCYKLLLVEILKRSICIMTNKIKLTPYLHCKIIDHGIRHRHVWRFVF